MTVISLEVKRRIHEADARIGRLERLLSMWAGYCDQAGEGHPFDELNPVHVLLRDTREALGKTVTNAGESK
jgi:hypothetical protein